MFSILQGCQQLRMVDVVNIEIAWLPSDIYLVNAVKRKSVLNTHNVQVIYK